MKYAEIKDLKSLDAARTKLAVQIADKQKDIARQIETVRRSYSPAAVTASAINGISGVIPFNRIVLSLVRRLLSRLDK